MRFVIPDVPWVKQRASGWCGYATLTAVLRYWGQCLDQLDVAAFLRGGEIRQDDTSGDWKGVGFNIYVTIGQLAQAAMNMSDHKVTLAVPELYQRLERVSCDRSMRDAAFGALRGSIIRGVPVIIHHVDHFYVVCGFDDKEDYYCLRDSRENGKDYKCITQSHFESVWSRRTRPDEGNSNRLDTRYSQLIIRPKNGGA
ncbi:hypothetical protein CL654_00155 [bacterium]|nr:hypothetical protein [bacterium]|tara:strand:+ start:96 stop:689 length:594 start_codon:yes stop_codon:yes gene_type:complete